MQFACTTKAQRTQSTGVEAGPLNNFACTVWCFCTAFAKHQISLPGLRVLRAFVVSKESIRLSMGSVGYF